LFVFVEIMVGVHIVLFFFLAVFLEAFLQDLPAPLIEVHVFVLPQFVVHFSLERQCAKTPD
jgi:hypothetical protein